MSTENTVDRLLTDARKKTARQENPILGKVALGVGVIALLASWIILAGWILGAAALVLGAVAVRRPVSAKLAKIAMTLGFVAILVSTFIFTYSIAQF